MPVGDKQIQPAVVIEIQESRSPGEKRCRGPGKPRHVGHIRKTSVPVISVERFVIIGKRRREKIDSPCPLVIPNRDPHGRLFAAVIAQGKSRRIALVFKGPVVLVSIKVVRCGIIRHHQIHPTVIIDIHESRSQPIVSVRVRNSRIQAHIRERPISIVVKQVIAFARQSSRPAHHVDPSELAKIRGNPSLPGNRRILDVVLHIPGHEQIQQTVAVVVAPRRPRRPSPQRHARLLRDVRKSPIVIVVVQAVLPEIRHINIRPPVVVVVAHRDAESPSFVRYSRFLRHIRKGPVMIIVEEHRSWRSFFSLHGLDRGSIQQVNIKPAVIVVVQQRYAGSNRL